MYFFQTRVVMSWEEEEELALPREPLIPQQIRLV